ncbi:hypothetical protein [Polaromonas sp. JS666]|uniref:hypothetical protein n=1 Tax=Polaromonas sp. (strain JS666 / ATCC BAA-500) TaxID=296591 RepID=UPI000322F34E|nr:hypothetical protein [Polaromonas sp. JS666]
MKAMICCLSALYDAGVIYRNGLTLLYWLDARMGRKQTLILAALVVVCLTASNSDHAAFG